MIHHAKERAVPNLTPESRVFGVARGSVADAHRSFVGHCTCNFAVVNTGTVLIFKPGCELHGGSGLTARQRETCRAIDGLADSRGWPPTYREIAKVLGVRSTNAVHCLLDPLYRKGVLAGSSITRSLRVLPLFERGQHMRPSRLRKVAAPSRSALGANAGSAHPPEQLNGAGASSADSVPTPEVQL